MALAYVLWVWLVEVVGVQPRLIEALVSACGYP